MTDERTVNLTINGTTHSVSVRADQTLLNILRDKLELSGAREACGIGMCGACTVLINGRALSSCLMLAWQAEGKEITTVEGLSEGDELHPVQQAYVEHAGFQCAYCTPGFVMSTVALLKEHPNPDVETVREYLAGNICRCGSYVNILEAVLSIDGLESE